MLLSGEILIRTPLSVAILPPPSLIELCKAMATLATLANQQNIDDDDIYMGKYSPKNFVFFFSSSEKKRNETENKRRELKNGLTSRNGKEKKIWKNVMGIH